MTRSHHVMNHAQPTTLRKGGAKTVATGPPKPYRKLSDGVPPGDRRILSVSGHFGCVADGMLSGTWRRACDRP